MAKSVIYYSFIFLRFKTSICETNSIFTFHHMNKGCHIRIPHNGTGKITQILNLTLRLPFLPLSIGYNSANQTNHYSNTLDNAEY